MQSSRAAAILAAAAVLTGGLTACGDEEPVQPSTTTPSPIGKDSTSGTSTSSSSSTGSSSSTTSGGSTSAGGELPADLPPEAREETKEGAAAFGEYYFLALGNATHTGDTQIVEMLDMSDCEVCQTGVKDIKKDAKKGWTRSTNPYSLSKTKATKRPDEGYKVVIHVDVAAHERLDSKGQANGKVDATSYTLTQHVVWRSGRWQMQDWIVT